MQYLKIFLLVFLAAEINAKSKCLQKGVVELPDGKIRGHTMKSYKGKTIYAYQEIPYAAPPIGNRRFKEPVQPKPWKGVLNATRNTVVCMQDLDVLGGIHQSEDCLYLNVFTPSQSTVRKSLPVMVFVHGGEGGAIQYYNPKYLMDYDIIVVTMNYRLGVFGFLATSDGTLPGNLGLKDQLMAIRWVNKNIHLFGGDSSRVTVMGSGPGAASLAYLQQNQLANDLVRGFILDCGTSFTTFSYQSKPDYYAFKLGRTLDENFNSNNPRDLLKLLQRFPADDIMKAPIYEEFYNSTLAMGLVWLPTFEKSCHKNAFITKPMVESYMKGDFQKAPILIGTSDKEAFGLAPVPDTLVREARRFDSSYKELIHPHLNVSEEDLEEAGRQYKLVYTDKNFVDDIDAFITFIGEDEISTPSIHYATLVSKHAPVYFWQFSYRGTMGGGYLTVYNAGHAENLLYMLGGVFAFNDDPSIFPDIDQLTMARVLKIWTNFVKYQNPTPKSDELLNGISWPKFTSSASEYVDINTNLTIRSKPKNYEKVKAILQKYARPPYYVF